MKKVITSGIVLMTVLMGCSFSKTSNHQESQKAELEQRDIFTAIKSDDITSLEKDLESRSPEELDQLDADGNSLFDAALERGSSDAIKLLLKHGVSPYKPNAHGVSFYNKMINSPSKYDDNILFKMPGLTLPLSILQTDDWSGLSSLVNNFLTPCDKVISSISAKKINDRKTSIAKFISASPACRYSLNNQQMAYVFQKELSRLIALSFVNMSDIVALTEILPKNFLYTQIYDSGDLYLVHPLLIIKTLRSLNPIRADELIKKISLNISSNDPMISVVLKSDDKKSSRQSKTISTFDNPPDRLISQMIDKEIQNKFSQELERVEDEE